MRYQKFCNHLTDRGIHSVRHMIILTPGRIWASTLCYQVVRLTISRFHVQCFSTSSTDIQVSSGGILLSPSYLSLISLTLAMIIMAPVLDSLFWRWSCVRSIHQIDYLPVTSYFFISLTRARLAAVCDTQCTKLGFKTSMYFHQLVLVTGVLVTLHSRLIGHQPCAG